MRRQSEKAWRAQRAHVETYLKYYAAIAEKRRRRRARRACPTDFRGKGSTPLPARGAGSL